MARRLTNDERETVIRNAFALSSFMTPEMETEVGVRMIAAVPKGLAKPVHRERKPKSPADLDRLAKMNAARAENTERRLAHVIGILRSNEGKTNRKIREEFNISDNMIKIARKKMAEGAQ